jgi:hypothetical protein
LQALMSFSTFAGLRSTLFTQSQPTHLPPVEASGSQMCWIASGEQV